MRRQNKILFIFIIFYDFHKQVTMTLHNIHLGSFFLIKIDGLTIEAVVCCTSPWGKFVNGKRLELTQYIYSTMKDILWGYNVHVLLNKLNQTNSPYQLYLSSYVSTIYLVQYVLLIAPYILWDRYAKDNGPISVFSRSLKLFVLLPEAQM